MTRHPFLVLLCALPLAAAPPAAGSTGAPPFARLQEQIHTLDVPRSYDGPPLTLAAALDEALERNPTLIALRRQFDVARARPDRIRFLMPPTFEAQIWQWPIDTINPANTEMYMFTARQELPGRGKRQAQAAVLEREAAIAENAIAVRAREVVEDVKRAYADLFLARMHVDIRLQTVDLLRQFADAAELRYVAGRFSQQDVLEAVVELSKVHEDLVLMDQRASLAEARLNALLDRPPDAPIGRVGVPHERVVLPPSSELQRRALERHPELRSAVLEREHAEAARAAVRTEYTPDFFVAGGYMLMPRGRDAWTASVGITWPSAPWSRGRLDAGMAEATAAIDAAAARQRVVENAIRLAVQEAYVRVETAARRAALVRTSLVPQAEQALELSRIAYETDRAGFLASIDKQRVLLDVQLGYYAAVSDLEQALADLERAAGVDLTPEILAPPPAHREEQP